MRSAAAPRWPYIGVAKFRLKLAFVALCFLACRANAPAEAGLEPSPAGSTGCPKRTDLGIANRWNQLESVDCLMRRGQLAQAISLLDEMEEAFASDRPLMRETSQRLVALLQTPGRLSSLPSRLKLADSVLPVPALEASIGGRVGLLIWDSGNELTALDEAVCAELGLARIAEVGVRDSSGGTRGGSSVGLLPPEFVLNGVQMTLPGVVCTDLAHVRSLEPRFLGILGANILGATSYQLDLARRELGLGAPLPAALVRLDAAFQNGMPYVSANVSGRTVDFLLDTGADFSVLSARTIEELGLPVRFTGGERTTYDAGGTTLESRERVLVGRLRSGREVRESIELRIGGLNLLGVDFLGKRTLVVDRATGLVALTR